MSSNTWPAWPSPGVSLLLLCVRDGLSGRCISPRAESGVEVTAQRARSREDYKSGRLRLTLMVVAPGSHPTVPCSGQNDPRPGMMGKGGEGRDPSQLKPGPGYCSLSSEVVACREEGAGETSGAPEVLSLLGAAPDPVWCVLTFWVSVVISRSVVPTANQKKKSENLLLDLVSKYFLSGQGEHVRSLTSRCPPVSGPGLCQRPHRAGFTAVLPSCRPKGVVWGQRPGAQCFLHTFRKEKAGDRLSAFKEKAETGSLHCR